jgi:hypothetical protein
MTDSTIADSSSLPGLAVRIRAEHEATAATLKDSIEHALQAGALLIEAKRQLESGWRPWLAEQCAFSEDTANRYMRFAKHYQRDRYYHEDLTVTETAAILVWGR